MDRGDSESQERLKRIHDRLKKSGFSALNDREIIELLVEACPLRQWKKPLGEYITKFENLRDFLSASPQELEESGFCPDCVMVELLREIPARVLKESIVGQPVVKSAEDVFKYLYFSMRDIDEEVLKVIYLNNQNQIIEIADLAEGRASSSNVDIRRVMESAIKYGAASLVLVHNHPSGNPKPSKSDRNLTRDMVFAGRIMNIKILDHIIIGAAGHFSFAGEGLVEEYEMDFLDFRIRGTAEAKLKRERDMSTAL